METGSREKFELGDAFARTSSWLECRAPQPVRNELSDKCPAYPDLNDWMLWPSNMTSASNRVDADVSDSNPLAKESGSHHEEIPEHSGGGARGQCGQHAEINIQQGNEGEHRDQGGTRDECLQDRKVEIDAKRAVEGVRLGQVQNVV